jgi:Tfp pilus assembly protein PilF
MDHNSSLPSERTSRRPQFSLGSLLGLVALVAVFLSLRSLFDRFDGAVVVTGLALFEYLAFRSVVGSRWGRETASTDRAEPGSRRRITTPRTIAVVAVVSAAGGAWLCGLHLFALLKWECPRDSTLGIVVPLAWTLGGVALAAGTAGLAGLFAGLDLGRRFACPFALALGWLAGAVPMVVWRRFGESLAPAWACVTLTAVGLVAGVLWAVLVPGFGRHARRWAAWAASPVLTVGTLVLFYRFVAEYLVSKRLVVRDIILLAAAVWLAAIVAGMIGALLGALRDRRGRAAFSTAAATSAAIVDLPGASWPVVASEIDISGIQRLLARKTQRRELVLLAVLLALLTPVLAYPHRDGITRFFHEQRPALVDFLNGQYDSHREAVLLDAIRMQTIDLPPVDRAEVFSLAEPPDPFTESDPPPEPNRGFSVQPYDRLVPIENGVTLTGQEAEELAQLWRNCVFDETGGALDHRHYYGLRFHSRGRLILETTLCWECSNCSIEDGVAGHTWIGFWDQDEKLLDRLQEIAPLSNDRKAWLLVLRAWGAASTTELGVALGHLNEAIAMQPDFAIAHHFRGVVHARLGKSDEALADYGKSLAIEPGDRTYEARGDLYAARGEPNRAIDDYTKAIQLQEARQIPVEALQKRGLAFLRMGEYHKALADFNRILKDQPLFWTLDSKLYRLRANVYDAMGDGDRAEADRNTAASIDSVLGVPQPQDDAKLPAATP